MSLPYRLLAIDLDGTLLNSAGKLAEGNRAALHRAHAAGLVICLCTGRSLTESREVIRALDLELDAGVFVFGSMVTDLRSGAPLFRTPMEAGLADAMVHHLGGRGHPVLALYDVEQAGFDYLLVEGRLNCEAYDRWLSFAPAKTRRIPAWQPQPFPPLRVGIIEQPDRIQATLSELRSAFPADQAKINSIYAPNYALHVVECFAAEVNKWYGISLLAGRLGIAGHEIATIGDDINDLEMISQAGLGVAMGNAIEPIRLASRYQVPTNDQGGVGVLVDRLLANDPDLPPPIASRP